MKPTHFLNIDLAKVYAGNTREKFKFTLAWGDEVIFLEQGDRWIKIQINDFRQNRNGDVVASNTTGFIVLPASSDIKIGKVLAPISEKGILKIDFVDVQQGDALVVETPQNEIMLVDGGDNQMFARYLAARFKGTTAELCCDVAAILVTHGDADHFSGLVKISESESDKKVDSIQRLFMKPANIFHNGLVKRPAATAAGKKRKETEMLGTTAKDSEGRLCIKGLEEDLLKVADEQMNTPFRAWKKAIASYKARNSNMKIRRLDQTRKDDLNIFQTPGISLQVLAPLVHKVAGKPVLRFLHEPSRLLETSQLKTVGREITNKNFSASHTINGHSVVFKLKYNNFSMLFTGDLNEESEKTLVEESKRNGILNSIVLKVPHHGSADFSTDFLAAVNPLVSVVSSGDENEQKEFIHPRATLMGALGRNSRTDRPLIFVTELVAFFEKVGSIWSTTNSPAKAKVEDLKPMFAFKRTAFGIVKLRTDGKRLLVYTNSGQRDLKEAYVFDLSKPEKPVRKDLLVV